MKCQVLEPYTFVAIVRLCCCRNCFTHRCMLACDVNLSNLSDRTFVVIVCTLIINK